MTHKIALVTGGASGIGKATSMQLASQGITVVFSDYEEESANAAMAEINSAAANDAKVRFVQHDIRSETDVKKMIKGVVEEFGRLDFAVNNAGICSETLPLDQSDTEQCKVMIDTNILGTYYCMKHEISQMKEQGSGAIVNVASIVGLKGMKTVPAYSATKHAIVGLTKSAALDHATEGVRINAVAPGGVLTNMSLQAAARRGVDFDADAVGASHPMNRIGTAEEIAAGIAWLLSEKASFMTGHVMSMDGGMYAG